MGKARETVTKQASVIEARDPATLPGQLREIGGSRSDDWNNLVANQALRSMWLVHSDQEDRKRQQTAAVAAMIGIGPKDELEGMMAAQLIAAHNAAMECYRRAMLGEQTFEGRRENLAQANKLGRTFAALLDTLNRHRGKGQQKVTVEHVHVHSGGQAVVGIVDTPGGGARANSEEQPHAKPIAHAPQLAMRSPNERREPLPVASDAERPLPDARRSIAGSAKA
jgi:hypothetical protein